MIDEFLRGMVEANGRRLMHIAELHEAVPMINDGFTMCGSCYTLHPCETWLFATGNEDQLSSTGESD